MRGAQSATYGSFTCAEQSRLMFGAFGISALEARGMDPQQSFVLHVGYSALRRGLSCAAQKTSPLRDALMYSNVGVSVGVEASGLSDSAEDANVFSASGGALSITSGRLSYALGLVGPCYSIDVACASSLAALHVCAAAGIGDVGEGGGGACT